MKTETKCKKKQDLLQRKRESEMKLSKCAKTNSAQKKRAQNLIFIFE